MNEIISKFESFCSSQIILIKDSLHKLLQLSNLTEIKEVIKKEYLSPIIESANRTLAVLDKNDTTSITTVYVTAVKTRDIICSLLSSSNFGVFAITNNSETFPLSTLFSREEMDQLVNLSISENLLKALASESDFLNQNNKLLLVENPLLTIPSIENKKATLPKRSSSSIFEFCSGIVSLIPLFQIPEASSLLNDIFISKISSQLPRLTSRLQQIIETSSYSYESFCISIGGISMLIKTINCFECFLTNGELLEEIVTDKLSKLENQFTKQLIDKVLSEVTGTVLVSFMQIGWRSDRPIPGTLYSPCDSIQYFGFLLQNIIFNINSFITEKESIIYQLAIKISDCLLLAISNMKTSEDRSKKFTYNIFIAISILKSISLFINDSFRRDIICKRLTVLFSIASIHSCNSTLIISLLSNKQTNAIKTPNQILGNLKKTISPNLFMEINDPIELISEIQTLIQSQISDEVLQSSCQYLFSINPTLFHYILSHRHDSKTFSNN